VDWAHAALTLAKGKFRKAEELYKQVRASLTISSLLSEKHAQASTRAVLGIANPELQVLQQAHDREFGPSSVCHAFCVCFCLSIRAHLCICFVFQTLAYVLADTAGRR
jgi:hypothetical protein